VTRRNTPAYAAARNAALQRGIAEAAERVQRTFADTVAEAVQLLAPTAVTRCTQAGQPFRVELRRAADLISLEPTPGDLLCIVEIEWSDEVTGQIVTSWAPGYGPAAAEAPTGGAWEPLHDPIEIDVDTGAITLPESLREGQVIDLTKRRSKGGSQ
jgi:hypothetical protein